MNRFKLKPTAGEHEQDGRVYKAGEIVESPDDLDVMFPNKFKRLGGKTKIVKSEFAKTTPVDEKDPELDPEEQEDEDDEEEEGEEEDDVAEPVRARRVTARTTPARGRRTPHK